MNHQITKLLLNAFKTAIDEANDALIAHYGLENTFTAPIVGSKNGKVPIKGTIKYEETSIAFRFHGGGCAFNVNGLVLDFNYVFDSAIDYKISFGPYEFKKFVQSLSNSTIFLTGEEKVVAEHLSEATDTAGAFFRL